MSFEVTERPTILLLRRQPSLYNPNTFSRIPNTIQSHAVISLSHGLGRVEGKAKPALKNPPITFMMRQNVTIGINPNTLAVAQSATASATTIERSHATDLAA